MKTAWSWLRQNAELLKMLGATIVLIGTCLLSYISLNSRAYASENFINKNDYHDDKSHWESRFDRLENKVDDINTYLRKGR